MRRFAFLVAGAGIFFAGCDAAESTGPSPADTVISTELKDDSTPPASPPNAPTEAASGGIMIGSGT
jgi:hypothetical protein